MSIYLIFFSKNPMARSDFTSIIKEGVSYEQFQFNTQLINGKTAKNVTFKFDLIKSEETVYRNHYPGCETSDEDFSICEYPDSATLIIPTSFLKGIVLKF